MKNNFDCLIISPGYPRWSGDYTHPMVFNLARILNDVNIRCVVSTIHYPKSLKREIINNVLIHRAKYAPEKFEVLGSDGGLVDDIRNSHWCKLLSIFMLITLAIQSYRLAKQSKFILVQWVPTMIVALPIKFLLRKKIFIQSRTYPDTHFWKLVYKLLLQHADGVIYNSHDNRALTNLVYRHSSSTVIGSGISIEQFRKNHREIKRATNWEFKAIVIARLIEFKGVEYAIKAIKALKMQKINVRLSVYGDGPLRKPLSNLIKDLKLESEIELYGAVAHREIPEKLYESDVFILPSIVDQYGRTEGFGAVILEAMAAGVPVIASNVGGIVDLVNDTNGILVKEKDPESIAGAIKNLMNNDEYRNSLIKEGLRFVSDNYSDEKIVKKYLDFFDKNLALN